MPTARQVKAHGGIKRVRTFKRNGVTYRIYVYNRKGKDGKKTYVDRVKKRR